MLIFNDGTQGEVNYSGREKRTSWNPGVRNSEDLQDHDMKTNSIIHPRDQGMQKLPSTFLRGTKLLRPNLRDATFRKCIVMYIYWEMFWLIIIYNYFYCFNLLRFLLFFFFSFFFQDILNFVTKFILYLFCYAYIAMYIVINVCYILLIIALYIYIYYNIYIYIIKKFLNNK